MNITDDVYNLAYSCLIDGGTEPKRITLEDAADTIQNWKDEGIDEINNINGLTPESFMAAWNEVSRYFRENRRKNDAQKAIKASPRAAHMWGVARMAMALLKMTRPERDIEIAYARETADSIEDFTEWQRERNHIHAGDEYFFVWDIDPDWDTDEPELLYAVNVTADSVLTAAAELMDLLSRKF